MGLFNWKNGQDGNTPINATNLNLAQQQIVDTIYPIGAIYISTNSTSPETLFGIGTWERVKDTFLLSAGDTYSAGTTGGEATHTLTEEEMPRHKHAIYQDATGNGRRFAVVTNYGDGGGQAITKLVGDGISSLNPYSGDNAKGLVNADYTGGNQAFNNMPPYLAVYMWKRTS